MENETYKDSSFILAAEDCQLENFHDYHTFSKNDSRIISKLLAHGPVLLKGARGSGKSALMIEAFLNMAPNNNNNSVFGIYISLRHLELLRSKGELYEKYLCKLLIRETQKILKDEQINFLSIPTISSVQKELSNLATILKKRIVILFDDAAHIGREAPLHEFFDIFRTFSSSLISCKASIYPGVTNFGTRFDVYNDATVIDISKNEEIPGFKELYADIIRKRFPDSLPEKLFSPPFDLITVADFLGKAVLGNMRGFLFACNTLASKVTGKYVGLNDLSETLLSLSGNYYWPLLEEVKPKLGMYEPMTEPATEIAEELFKTCGDGKKRSALIFRDIIQRLSKPFEILEYTGFIIRRDVSRAMKSGGRGSRYLLNLCLLMEYIPKTRLTNDLYESWSNIKREPVEFHRRSTLNNIELPEKSDKKDLVIFDECIDKIKKSHAYPYGLTEHKLEALKNAGYKTVGDLASVSDKDLLCIDFISKETIKRFKNTIYQAIWM